MTVTPRLKEMSNSLRLALGALWTFSRASASMNSLAIISTQGTECGISFTIILMKSIGDNLRIVHEEHG